MASNIRAMPENEKPPARRVDVYFDQELAITNHKTSFDLRVAEKYPLSGENSPVKEECVYKCEVTKVVEGEKKI